MAISLSTLLNQDGGKAFCERRLVTKTLARREWKTPMLNPAYGFVQPIEIHAGQFAKFTRKGRARRPETMASPDAGGSDPASGVNLTVDQFNVPLELTHEYGEIVRFTADTSWLAVEEYVTEEMGVAALRRFDELAWNAFEVGRMTPGLYASDGTLTTSFDQSAAASLTVYGQTFTFQSAPKYYATGLQDHMALSSQKKSATWKDMRSLYIKMHSAGAKLINGGLMCVCSAAFWNDLLMDDDGGRLTAAIAGGLTTAIKGLEDYQVFKYAGWNVVLSDSVFTENESTVGTDNEGKRANYGPIHSALCFGAESFVWTPMGSKKIGIPKFFINEYGTKTGYSYTVGYQWPYQIAVINPDWCAVIKSFVSESKPNNYLVTNPTKQLQNFGV